MTVYLLHFKEPISHAKHYIGWTNDLVGRIMEHSEGRGARITQVLKERGGTFALARVWEGKDRAFERHLKSKGKNAPHLCPICSKNAMKRMEG